MTRIKTIRVLAVLLLILPAAFSACVKDNCKRTRQYQIYTPVYKDMSEVLGNIRSNPARPLKNTGKFYIYGNYIFLNEIDKGVHVIDNSDPSNPVNVAFIDIPGDVDLAVKGNILYADMYQDLVAIDISNPEDIVLKKTVANVFPERQYSMGFVPQNGKVIVDWIIKDTTVVESCDQQWVTFRMDAMLLANAGAQIGSAASSNPVGIGGSMARFTVVNDYMYTVDRHTLRTVSISNPADPVVASTTYAGWDIETIYPFKDKLFLGSMGGLFIFDISNPVSPVSAGTFQHARACDPVIADDKYAYVTLREGTNCGPAEDQLLVVDVQNVQSPSLVKSYSLSGPYGLSKDGNMLFVCDGKAGLKVYNASNVQDLQLIRTITGIETYDVIAYNKRLIVVAKGGLYQYDYSIPGNIRLLSKMEVNK